MAAAIWFGQHGLDVAIAAGGCAQARDRRSSVYHGEHGRVRCVALRRGGEPDPSLAASSGGRSQDRRAGSHPHASSAGGARPLRRWSKQRAYRLAEVRACRRPRMVKPRDQRLGPFPRLLADWVEGCVLSRVLDGRERGVQPPFCPRDRRAQRAKQQ